MRPIKFRAWLKAAHRMVTPTSLRFLDNGHVWVKVDDLTTKLQAAKADSDQLAQAIKDAQDVKDYSAQAVEDAQ